MICVSKRGEAPIRLNVEEYPTMLHIVSAARIIAALIFSAALAGGVAAANAQPCQLHLANGQLAPCAPGVVSHSPSDPGGGNDPAYDPASFEHVLVKPASPIVEEPEPEPEPEPTEVEAPPEK